MSQKIKKNIKKLRSKIHPSQVMLPFSLLCIGLYACKTATISLWLYHIIYCSCIFAFLLAIGERGRDYLIYDVVKDKLLPKVILPLYVNAILYVMGSLRPMIALAIVSGTLFLSELTTPPKNIHIKLKVVAIRAFSMIITWIFTNITMNLESPHALALAAFFGMTSDSLQLFITFFTPAFQIFINYWIRLVTEKFNKKDNCMLVGIAGTPGLLLLYLYAGEYQCFVKMLLPIWVALFKEGFCIKNLRDLHYVFINCIFGQAYVAFNFSDDMSKKYISKTTGDTIAIIKNVCAVLTKRNFNYKKAAFTENINTYNIPYQPFYWKYYYTWDYQKTQNYLM